MNDDRQSCFWCGLLIGGLLGVTAGVLLAPRAGQETRDVVNQKVKDVLQKIEHVISEQRDAIEIAIAEGKETAEKTTEDVKNVLSEVMAKAERPE